MKLLQTTFAALAALASLVGAVAIDSHALAPRAVPNPPRLVFAHIIVSRCGLSMAT